MDKSDEFGSLFYDIKEVNTDYRFAFINTDGQILKQTNTLQFSCDSGICTGTFLIDPTLTTTSSPNITFSLTQNNVTGILNLAWTDPTFKTSTVRMVVSTENALGTLQLCNTTQSGAAGNMDCNITGYTQSRILVRGFSTASPELPRFLAWLEPIASTLSDILGARDSALWAMGIFLTIGVVGFFSSAGIAITVPLALIFMYMIGILNVLTLTGVLVVSVLSVLVGLKVRT
jgi:hypothetical protein